MSYGAYIENYDSIVLLDQNFDTYAVYSYGAAASTFNSAGSVWGGSYDFYIAIPNIAGVLVFIRGSGEYFCKDGGAPGTTLTISSYYSAASINYIIVVPSGVLSASSSYGLNIYKPNGALSFSSLHTHMTLVSMPSFQAHVGGTLVLPFSSKNRYININALYRTGTVNAATEDSFHYLGNIHLQGSLSGGVVTMSNSDYLFFSEGFGSGSLTGGAVFLTDTRQILILETHL
jgi:hypothetical protein